jgi:hypothetical protein
MDRSSHWNRVYETKQPDAVSWYQRSPEKSLGYVQKLATVTQKVIDVGGGASSTAIAQAAHDAFHYMAANRHGTVHCATSRSFFGLRPTSPRGP